jgi:hydrogenase maturation protease
VKSIPSVKSLVIGYGNTLRGDDGVGYYVAEAVESWQLPEVESRPCHQLTPELAAELAAADRVIFVDATPPQNPHSPIVVERIVPGENAAAFSGHHSSPHALLSLTQKLYSKRPVAYTLLLPSWEMGFSETLSPIAKLGLSQGLQRLRELLGQDLPGPAL